MKVVSGQFLPVVDALRAVAVVSVVGYHSGLEFLPGGFVGVDIFFVISGFLIVNHIINEHRNGQFSFGAFYARRAIRILPPYFIVIAASILIAAQVLVLESEIRQFSKEVVWSAVMLVNYLFLGQQGYFDTAAESKPLLHLWSLAVEEQFYAVAPLLIAGFWVGTRRLGGAARTVAGRSLALAGLILSFVACIWFSVGETNHAFYQMPLRAWEFIAGAMMATVANRLGTSSRLISEGMVALGLVLIGYSIAAFDRHTPFPSYWAALPVAGSCLIIAGGIAHRDGFLARAISIRPVLLIGLVSYGWYLWHWPLLTFGRIYGFQEPDIVRDCVLSLVALGLAILMYLLVERPLAKARVRGKIASGWRPAFVGGIGSAVVAMAGIAIPSAFSFNASLDPATGKGLRQFTAETCLRDRDACLADKVSTILVLGDSHAATTHAALSEAFPEVQIVRDSTAACLPFFDIELPNRPAKNAEDCRHIKETALTLARDSGIPTAGAILYARWNIYTPWTVALGGSEKVPFLSHVGTLGDDPHDHFLAAARHTASLLEQAGVSRILIIAPTPEFWRYAPECIARSIKYGANPDQRCSIPLADNVERRAMSVSWIAEAFAGISSVRTLDPLPAFCDNSLCRSHGADNTALFVDDDHMSYAGMNLVISRFPEEFRWVTGR